MLTTLFRKNIITNMKFEQITIGLNKLFNGNPDNKYKVLAEDFTLVKYPSKYIIKADPVDRYLLLPNINITYNANTTHIEIFTTLNLFFLLLFIIVLILMVGMIFIFFQIKDDADTRFFQLISIIISFAIIYRNIKYCKETLETADIFIKSADY